MKKNTLYDCMITLTKQVEIRELLSQCYEKHNDLSYDRLLKKINNIIIIDNLEEVFPEVNTLNKGNIKLLLSVYRGLNCLSYHIKDYQDVYKRIEGLTGKYRFNEMQIILKKEGFNISKDTLKNLLFYYCAKNDINYKKIDSIKSKIKLLNVSKQEWEELVRKNSVRMILHKLGIGIICYRSNIEYHNIDIERDDKLNKAYNAELSKIKKGEFFDNRIKFIKN